MEPQLGAALLELARFKTALTYCDEQCAVSPSRKKKTLKKNCQVMCQENIFSTLVSIHKHSAYQMFAI